jgi:short-subunit dehydrogenase
MKKAIVIGATSGIGKALAEILITKNYKVGIAGRRTVQLEELYAKHPNNVVYQCIDVSKTEAVNENLNNLVEQLGGLDLFINAAGVGFENELLEFNPEKVTIETNVLGFTAVIGWAFHYLCNQNHGQLCNISSIACLRGYSDAPAYFGSKSYQASYFESLRKRANIQKSKITITDIRPGFVATNLALGDGIFWMASVNKASKQIYNAISRKAKVAYVTKRWNIIAFMLKIAPKSLYDHMR